MIAGVWTILSLACVTPPGEKVAEPCEACAGECLQDTTPAAGRAHVEGEVDYADFPPSSGNHNACWAEWGVHTEVVQPENWVHNLEHGGVVFLYSAELVASELASLTSFVEGLPEGRALLSPASDPMDALVAAVSWEHRILLGCYDEAALNTFFLENLADAPEDVTSGPGESCGMDDTAVE